MEKLYAKTKLKNLAYIIPGNESERSGKELANGLAIGGLIALFVIGCITIVLHYADSIDASPMSIVIVFLLVLATSFYKLWKMKR